MIQSTYWTSRDTGVIHRNPGTALDSIFENVIESKNVVINLLKKWWHTMIEQLTLTENVCQSITKYVLHSVSTIVCKRSQNVQLNRRYYVVPQKAYVLLSAAETIVRKYTYIVRQMVPGWNTLILQQWELVYTRMTRCSGRLSIGLSCTSPVHVKAVVE